MLAVRDPMKMRVILRHYQDAPRGRVTANRVQGNLSFMQSARVILATIGVAGIGEI